MDTLTLARVQMALSLMFHMVFAAIGIGLPLLLVIAEGLYLRTGRPHYLALTKRWAKATGLLFAVGAVSGTALSLELGLLWPKYMEITGAVVGHIFALEGYAFFVEAIFIGLYLYGWQQLSALAHWACGIVIAISGMLSGIFILGVNAWMQLPIGFERDALGNITAVDPLAIFRQYRWLIMALHSTLSCYTAVAFAVAGVYAWGYLQGKRDDYHRSAILLALAVGFVSAILQPPSGDLLAKFVFRTQPAKFAAMEGQFKTERYAPLRIGGIPNIERGETEYAIEIPGMLSFLAAHDFRQEVTGLDDIDRSLWPNVEVTHFAFQTMVGCGMLLIVVASWYWIRVWRRGALAALSPTLLWTLVLSAPLGFVALEAGWFVTEVGRQPWVIHNIMRTDEAVTPADQLPVVFWIFAVLYLVLGVTVIALLRWLAKHPAAEASQSRRAQDGP